MLKKAGNILKYVITLGFMALAFYTVGMSWRDWCMLVSQKSISLQYILLSLLGMLVIVAANSLKWQTALQVQGIKVKYLRVFYYYFSGYFFNSFITGTGDIKRGLDLGKETGNVSGTMASVIADRWSGVVGQISLGLITLILAFQNDLQIWPAVLGTSLFILLLFSVFYAAASLKAPQIDENTNFIIKTFWNIQGSFSVYKNNKLFLISGLLLGFIGPIMLIIVHFAAAQALEINAPFKDLFFYVPTISIFAQLPITINGFGLQDYFTVNFLGESLKPENALALSVVFHLIRLGIGLIGGIFYVLFPKAGKE